jgi:F-type H+-transporting ATPase subunit delta
VIQTAVAHRYAKALFSLLKASEVRPAADSLRTLADTFGQSRDFRALLLSPLFSREQKAAVVRKMAATAGAPAMVDRFLNLVVSKNRIRHIREISDAFANLADQASNRKVVRLRSAQSLSEQTRAAIQAQLEQATRSAIDLTTEVDPGLLGGLEIRIGSTVYDGTIRGQLEQMRAVLAKEV